MVPSRMDTARLAEAARCDGIFALVSNVATMSALELLLAYKQQPPWSSRPS
jgi:hypothetical protein